jgi:hypothetical protein
MWTRLIAGLALGFLVVGLAVGSIPVLAQTRSATLAGIIANAKLTGQLTLNGALCAAGQLLQGGSPTTCTASPTITGTFQAATVNATSKFQVNGVDFAVGTPCSNTAASSDITGTLTKTYFSVNCKIPANTLATVGDFVKLSMRGLYSGNATDTMTMTLEACQVQGCASGTKVTIHTAAAVTLTAVSNQGWDLDTQIISFTTGATGTHDAQGRIFYELTGTTATPDWLPNTAVVTWDDTVDEYLTMSVTFSTTSGNDHASIRNIVGTIQ